jgi:lipoyl(octanoyl) transferase
VNGAVQSGLQAITVRRLPGLSEYEATWQAMKEFTHARLSDTPDEIWLLQHPPVYTLGQAGDATHRLSDNGIPLVKVDRGGQITYHGPGQLVAYLLIDLRRRGITVKGLVRLMEQALLDALAAHGVQGELQSGAPGVYVQGAKVAALGLRVQKGCSTHGLSLNVNMDLSPFANINPCGYTGLMVTQTQSLGIRDSLEELQTQLLHHLTMRLNAQLRSL